ncbi:MAG: hypothetical protein ACW964_20540 [Candidatus Hodarchaeales archaeon]|jgi:hypothetical protein
MSIIDLFSDFILGYKENPQHFLTDVFRSPIAVILNPTHFLQSIIIPINAI